MCNFHPEVDNFTNGAYVVTIGEALQRKNYWQCVCNEKAQEIRDAS